VLVRLRDLTVAPGVAARARSGEVFGAAEERLRGAEELRALGGSRYAVDDLHRRSARTLAPFRRMTAFGMSLWSATIVIVVGGGLAVLAGGIVLQRAGAWSVGQVLVAFTATQLVRRPLEQVVGHLEQVQQAITGAARLAELFDEAPSVAFTGSAGSSPTGRCRSRSRRSGSGTRTRPTRPCGASTCGSRRGSTSGSSVPAAAARPP
jgi:ABC-type multidrug transport system fused ATPase/permease subunit